MSIDDIDLPDVLSLRLIDRTRAGELVDAIASRSKERVSEICTVAMSTLSTPDLRNWPGRLSPTDWTESARILIQGIQRRLTAPDNRGPDIVPIWDDIETAEVAFLPSYAMPWFQLDYLLELRDPAGEKWHSTATFRSEQESIQFFRALCSPSHRARKPDVRIAEVDPCSFVALGFLDGGAYRRAFTRDNHQLVQLLSELEQSRIQYEDVMWIAPPEWLQRPSDLLRNFEPSSDLFPRMNKLREVAIQNRLQIAISGTYGSTYGA